MALSVSFNGYSQFSFTTSPSPSCPGVSITFTNTSSSGVHYDWYMGDGTNYIDQVNATHAYADGGGYWVTMYAYDGLYNYLGFYDLYLEVSGPASTINMSSYVACPGDQISMSLYASTATAWSWDFDDGSFDSGYDYVNHTYSSAGEYHPTITMTTSDCGVFVIEDTVTITNSLTYFGGNSNLWLNPNSVCPGSNVSGQTQPGYSNYSWDYGDGNFGSGEYNDWSYGSVGSYNVQLTITNGCGIDTVLTDVVTVSNSTPVQNPQTQIADTICPNENTWVAAWANDGLTFVWDMGDGSPLINDSQHDYAYSSPGTYTASVTITNNCGNSVVLNETVVVSNSAQVNNPYLNLSQNVVCPGDQIDFWSNSEYDFYIDYGDGSGSNTDGQHGYATTGTYVVSATIQNACGNSVTITDIVYVQNNLPINVSNISAWVYPDPSCPGSAVEFDATYGYSDYQWNFMDGSTGTGQSLDHIYNSTGTYNVSVLIENGCGSQATTYVTVQIQDNLPIGNISLDILVDTTCIGDAVFIQFDGGEDDGYTYLWDLGDGTTATNFGVSHAYDALGTYPISVVVTNGCGNDTILYDTIVVSDNYTPNPSEIQAFVTNTGCVGDALSFVIIPSDVGDIVWDFGDGNTTTQVSSVFVQGIAYVDVSSHVYSAPGTYWASYTITNGCGNSVTDSVEITIGQTGDNISMDVELLYDQSQSTCQGTPIEFMAFGGGTYIWNFGDGSGTLVTYNSFESVYHTYENSGSYTVTVEGINGCGNTDNSDEVIVIPPSAIIVTTNTIIEPNCGINNGLAVVSATGGIPPYTYSWSPNGDQGVIADSLSSGIYVVTVTDLNDCSNEGIATVSDEEGVTILVNNVVNVNCYGNDNGSISITLLGGQPPYTIQWSNGDQTEDIFGLQAGPYEIFVTDADGCFSVESIEVTQPAKSNVSVITTAAACGSNNGFATASVNNGTPPYNFIWPNASGPSNQTGSLTPGIHTLLVIDGNTCLLQKDFAINEVGGPIIIADSTITGTCNGTLSSIYISTIGGTQPFTYDWSNGATNQDLTGVVPGSYEVEVEGSNGCSSFATYTVVETQPEQTAICLVDVDSVTNTNIVVWNKINNPGIASYNIYKESSQAGLYYLIGNQDADSLTQYFDYLSNPNIRSWRYKVAALDDCGNEAPLSDHHKTIHLTSNQGISGEVNLIWDHYNGFAYPTYYVHRYHVSTGWQILDSLASTLTSFTDNAPPSDSNLVYLITINPPGTCTATKAQDYNSSRSNKESVNAPDEDNSGAGLSQQKVELNIYPNPTNGIVQIAYSEFVTQMRVYDISGKLVYSTEPLSQGVHKIDLSGYESGIYTIQIFTEKNTLNGKIIKE